MNTVVGLIFTILIFVVLPYLMFFDDKKKSKEGDDKADGGDK